MGEITISIPLTNVKVHRDLQQKIRINFPDFTANDILKLGYITLQSINKGNEILYGKSNVKKSRGLI